MEENEDSQQLMYIDTNGNIFPMMIINDNLKKDWIIKICSFMVENFYDLKNIKVILESRFKHLEPKNILELSAKNYFLKVVVEDKEKGELIYLENDNIVEEKIGSLKDIISNLIISIILSKGDSDDNEAVIVLELKKDGDALNMLLGEKDRIEWIEKIVNFMEKNMNQFIQKIVDNKYVHVEILRDEFRNYDKTDY